MTALSLCLVTDCVVVRLQQKYILSTAFKSFDSLIKIWTCCNNRWHCIYSYRWCGSRSISSTPFKSADCQQAMNSSLTVSGYRLCGGQAVAEAIFPTPFKSADCLTKLMYMPWWQLFHIVYGYRGCGSQDAEGVCPPPLSTLLCFIKLCETMASSFSVGYQIHSSKVRKLSKIHKRLKECFLIGWRRTKRPNFLGSYEKEDFLENLHVLSRFV